MAFASWTPLSLGLAEICSPLDPRAFRTELESATRFYQTLSLDSDEDTASETCSEASCDRSLYKTEMCATFQQYGACPYHDKCKFAHGAHELRKIPRHPKYKSSPCRNFLAGNCPYGARCCFKH